VIPRNPEIAVRELRESVAVGTPVGARKFLHITASDLFHETKQSSDRSTGAARNALVFETNRVPGLSRVPRRGSS
jgi:hypothetical protein